MLFCSLPGSRSQSGVCWDMAEGSIGFNPDAFALCGPARVQVQGHSAFSWLSNLAQPQPAGGAFVPMQGFAFTVGIGTCLLVSCVGLLVVSPGPSGTVPDTVPPSPHTRSPIPTSTLKTQPQQVFPAIRLH